MVPYVVGLGNGGAASAGLSLPWIVWWFSLWWRLGLGLLEGVLPRMTALDTRHPCPPDDWLTVDVGGKTTVIRLPDGSLFVHAPLLLTASLKRALAALGPVSVIVVPNTEHVDGAAQWVAAYPDAVALGPPGYGARSGVPLADIPADNTPHPAFASVIEHTFFGSMPLFSESVFFHRPSGTLLTTDTSPDSPPFLHPPPPFWQPSLTTPQACLDRVRVPSPSPPWPLLLLPPPWACVPCRARP